LRAGEPCQAEELLAGLDTLVDHADSVLELLYTEFVVREQLGQRPTPEEWFTRFPRWEADLRELFEVHRFVGMSGQDRLTESDTSPRSKVPQPPGDARRVGNYDLLEELGRGGMGVVYKARHLHLNRVVALKMILAGDHAGAQELARFRAEAEAAARLQHPNIVQIHEIGEHEGRPFFSLEFVEGVTLAKSLAGAPLPARRAAQLVETLARAMDHAHQCGVVHRDLKPANILVAADGTPRVTDFGLAKRLDVDAGPTRTGAVVGTPSYMAPEQARGDARQVGPAADIHALGAILYELLTGRPPFQGATPLDIVRQVLDSEPVQPARLYPGLPRDLETICLMCLRKEPDRRYASALELAEDLRRFLAGEPVRARPVGGARRLAKWVRRRPAPAALIAVSVLAALTVTVGSAWFAAIYQEERDRARDQEQTARAETVRANRGEAQALAAGARAETEWEKATRQLDRTRRHLVTTQLLRVALVCDTDPWLGRDLLHDADFCPPELRDFAWGYYERLCQRGRVVPLGAAAQRIHLAAFGADGKVVVTAGDAGLLRVWDTGTGREKAVFGPKGWQVTRLAMSADGATVAAASELRKSGQPLGTKLPREVKVWDAATGKELHTLLAKALPVTDLGFSADGRLLVSGTDSVQGGEVKVWEVATGKERAVFRYPRVRFTAVALSPDGALLAGGTMDLREVRVWEVATGKVRAAWPTGLKYINRLSFTPDGKAVTSVGGMEVRLWDLDTTKLLTSVSPELGGQPGAARSAISADRKLLATHDSGFIRVWDLTRDGRQLLPPLPTRGSLPLGLTFVQEGRGLSWVEWGGTVKHFDLPFRPEQVVIPLPQLTKVVALTSSGKTLALGGAGKETNLWDTADGQLRHRLPLEPGWVAALACTDDDRTLFSASWVAGKGPVDSSTVVELEVRAWDVATGHAQGTKTVPVSVKIRAKRLAALTSDGKRLACSNDVPPNPADPGQGWEKNVRLWDVDTGRLLHTLRGHPGGVGRLVFSPNGQTLATVGAGDNTVKVWDVATGRERLTLRGCGFSLAFSADSSLLVTGDRDRKVRLWDLDTGRERLALQYADGVTQVALTADGKTLAVGDGRLVKLWDVTTGQLRAAIPGHEPPLSLLKFSAAGDVLAVSDRDTMKLWRVNVLPQ
jgi:WD40 repeat protein